MSNIESEETIHSLEIIEESINRMIKAKNKVGLEIVRKELSKILDMFLD